jgi:hypothetical protein
VRATWFALVLLLIPLFVAGLSPYFNELRQVCAGEGCHPEALLPQEADVLRDLGLSLDFYAGYKVALEIYVAVISIPLAGLIFWRRSDTWIGILASLTLVLIGTITSQATNALLRLYPGLLLPSVVLVLDSASLVLFILLLYLFPDGRFVPRWTRVLAIVFAGSTLIDPILSNRAPLDDRASVGMGILLLGSLIVGLFAQIYRYLRVSTPAQRQQTKWVVFGLILVTIFFITWVFTAELFPFHPGPARLVFNLSTGIVSILWVVFPLSMVFSILRYRLWDIDVIIRRTLVYSAVTASLALVYAGSIVMMQSMFRALTGQQSPLAVVVSTLAIAALFTPLRKRVQQFVDRRFYREKYDAQQTLEAFSEHMRDEVDVDELQKVLLSAVENAFQPEQVHLWLRQTEGQRTASDETRRSSTAVS